MSRGRMPNVNASLLHEVRMFAQHFLAGRQTTFPSSPFFQARAKACTHTILSCIFCTKDAKFVINGQSVCVVHEVKARGASNRPRFPGE